MRCFFRYPTVYHIFFFKCWNLSKGMSNPLYPIPYVFKFEIMQTRSTGRIALRAVLVCRTYTLSLNQPNSLKIRVHFQSAVTFSFKSFLRCLRVSPRTSRLSFHALSKQNAMRNFERIGKRTGQIILEGSPWLRICTATKKRLYKYVILSGFAKYFHVWFFW